MINNALQQHRFRKLRTDFNTTYRKLKKLGTEPYVMPFWKSVNKKIEDIILPTPPQDFLNIQAIKDTMFVNGSSNWLNSQVDFLLNKMGQDFKMISRESPVGKPSPLAPPFEYTTHNKIHHLYHIFFYLDKTKRSLDDINTVVEWGGGYGNLAILWWKLKKAKTTYIIIDTALFSAIQWLYLSSVMGEGSVHLLKSRNDKIVKGKINIVPLALMKTLEVKGDLFVSTWGLSESSDKAQDYVLKQMWFDCPFILLGFQDETKELIYASRLGKLAKKDGAKIVDISFIPNNHYAFR